jgi:hypothetical protein
MLIAIGVVSANAVNYIYMNRGFAEKIWTVLTAQP